VPAEQEAKASHPRITLPALSSLTQYAAEERGVLLPTQIRRNDRPKIDPHDTSTATPVIEVDESSGSCRRARTPAKRSSSH
jgi:hypothetical protein